MSYQGDIRLGDTLDVGFTTTSASTGAPTTLSGTPVISAYVGNSTTQITAGITLSVDFDSITGYNNVRVVASSGNGYAAQTNVRLVITTGTVGGTSAVGYEIGSFSIENRSALRPTTAGRTLDVSSGGEAGVDWANVGSPTTTVGLSGTTISTTQAVASVSGAVGSVTGAVGSVTGAVGSVTGDVGGDVVGSIGSLGTQAKTDVENAAWDATLADHLDSGSTGAALNAAGSAGDPWATTLPGAYGAGTAGKIIGDNIDAAISSRSTYSGGAVASVTGDVGGNVTGSVGSVVGDVGGDVVGSVGSVTGDVGGDVVGSVGSVTAGVTVSTNSDKTGYALTVAYDAAKTAAQEGDIMKVSSGTGANQISLTSGKVDMGKINGTTVNGDGSATPWGP